MSLHRVEFEKLLNESPARVLTPSHIAINKLPFKSSSSSRPLYPGSPVLLSIASFSYFFQYPS